MLSDVVLEALCKSKLQDSVQLLVVLALSDQETVRNNGETNYLRLRTSVKLHIDQMKRTRNIRDRSDLVEKVSATQSRNRRKVCAARKVRVFSVEGTWTMLQETLVVSVMTKSLLATVAVVRDEKDDRRCPAPDSKAKTDGEEGNRDEGSDKRSQILIQYRKCKLRHVKFWFVLVCQNCRSESWCTYGDKSHFRHVEAEEKAQLEVEEKCAKGSVLPLGSVSQGFLAETIYSA